MSADSTTTDLLNKVRAIVKCGASTYKELSKETGIPYNQVWDFLNLRRNRPNGPRSMSLMRWAAKKTNQISMGPNKLQQRYRAEYRAACEKFPVNGKGVG